MIWFIQPMHAELIQQNQLKLMFKFKCIIVLCGRPNIALRGHRNDNKILEASNNEVNCGNFKALLQFWMESGDVTLKDQFSKSAKNVILLKNNWEWAYWGYWILDMPLYHCSFTPPLQEKKSVNHSFISPDPIKLNKECLSHVNIANELLVGRNIEHLQTCACWSFCYCCDGSLFWQTSTEFC